MWPDKYSYLFSSRHVHRSVAGTISSGLVSGIYNYLLVVAVSSVWLLSSCVLIL